MNRLQALFMAWIFPWVPKRLLSRLTGVVMRLPLPPILSGWIVAGFAKIFSIRTDEAERPLSAYRSLDDFFTRRLRAGLRPIQGDLVHPVDGVLTERGPVRAGELIQAKGWSYGLGEFLGDEKLATAYASGSFLTYYLCPADYHRVHVPCAGTLRTARHIPGMLWPVNQWSVSNIRRLFCLNERVVLNFESDRGRWSLVMVGATNVGHMTISVDPSISTNRWMWHAPTDRHYTPPIALRPGDELGIFHLGSTVICLFEAQVGVEQVGPVPVKMGQRLA